MDVSPDTIQIIIQGGAVGLLLVFGYWGQKLAHKAIDGINVLFTNHLEHTNAALINIESTAAVGNAKLDELNHNVRELTRIMRLPRETDAQGTHPAISE